MFPGSRNVPNVPHVPNVPNVPNDVPNIPGHVGQDGLLAEGYVAKISMLRLNIGSGMLRLSSRMLRLGLRLSIGFMLRRGLRLKQHILLLRWMSPFEPKIKTDISRFQHVDFWCFGLILTDFGLILVNVCLLYTSPSPRDRQKSRMPSSA